MRGSNGKTRLDTLVATKTAQLVTIEHATTAAERILTANLYPRDCNFVDACCKEFGGSVE
jgi:hypothetical protein